MTFLIEQGFEPCIDEGVIRLRNGPFHLQEHTELICGMNTALLGAIADVVEPGSTARLVPAPSRCCVAVHR